MSTETSLNDILSSIDVDQILIDSNGKEWTPDNIDGTESGSFCVDGVGIWRINADGFRDSQPVYRFKTC